MKPVPFVLVMLFAGRAAADHDHGAHAPAARDSMFATAGVLAATYDQRLFDGDYQGVTGSFAYARGRLSAGVDGAVFRLQKNGRIVRGPGDTVLHAQLDVWPDVGVVLAVMLPTGNADDGLGMGHLMLMPAVYARRSFGRVTVNVATGYGRGVGDESSHIEHGGVWPIVEPMNYQELTFNASVMVTLAAALRAGVRASMATAIGDGSDRQTAGVRAVWTTDRVETTFDISAGVVGDPYIFRGTLASAIRF
jgi:hypothetical protein